MSRGPEPLIPKKVHIIFGVLSGDVLGRRLRKELRAAGFNIARKRDQADIILAHSAGCFWLEDARPDQLLVLVDPPYWPGRTVKDRAKEKSDANFRYRRYGYSHHLWLNKNAWGLYYAVRDMKRTIRIAKHVKDYYLPGVIRDKQAVIVRNEQDAWCTPDLEPLKNDNSKLKIIEVPGEHDDLFFNPKRYAELLQSITWTET
jgi:hypothetical protein